MEIDHVFVGKYDGEVMLNPDEAVNYAWKLPSKILEDIQKNQDGFVPWLKMILESGQLR